MATAAIRFLRPARVFSSTQWLDVASLAEIQGENPIRRQVSRSLVAGWSQTVTPHTVFILPKQNNKVVSATCPHEGCEVSWQEDAKIFFCPCHNSDFAPDGSRISGPAPHGLEALNTRTQEGKLQVLFEDNPQSAGSANFS